MPNYEQPHPYVQWDEARLGEWCVNCGRGAWHPVHDEPTDQPEPVVPTPAEPRGEEPLARGGIDAPDAQPLIEHGGDYLAPPDVLSVAVDAADDAICRRLDHNQVIALVADAVWRLAYEAGHVAGHGQAVAAVQRPDQRAYERGIAEGLRQATEGADAVSMKTDAAWGEGYAEGRKELAEAAGAGYHRGVLVGLRQATEGWEREWGTQWATDPDLGTYPCDDEAEAREHVERYPGNVVVSRLVGPWEPAQQPEPAHEEPKTWAPGTSPAEKLRSLWAQPHGGSCTCRECIARDEQPAPAPIHVRHDPAALMEEPDLYADEQPEGSDRG